MRKKIKNGEFENSTRENEFYAKKRNRKDIFCQLLWSAKSLICVLLTAGLILNPYILD